MKVESERSLPQRLWQSVDSLFGRGRVPLSGSIDAALWHKFFDKKMDGVRTTTADAPLLTFVSVRERCCLDAFRLVTVDVVVAAVGALFNRQCASDPLPTSWLKGNIDLLAPFLVELFNQSLSTGYARGAFKEAYITPLLKKVNLDSADARSYRTISNLSVLSKLLERLVANQLLEYLNTERLLPSAYRAFHSTETAVL